MTERYIIDTCGTLIDMETRNTYDYVSEVCDLLNELNDENKELKADNQRMVKFIMSKGYNLKDYLDYIKELSE